MQSFLKGFTGSLCTSNNGVLRYIAIIRIYTNTA